MKNILSLIGMFLQGCASTLPENTFEATEQKLRYCESESMKAETVERGITSI